MILNFKIYNFFFLFFFILANNLNANNIAVFNINTIYEHNDNFQNFIMKINKSKKIDHDSLESDKKLIEILKERIDSDSLLLDQSEINKLLNEYNNKINKFNKDINNIELKYNKIIKENEKILINELIIIVEEIADLRKLDLILTEKSYFMVSDKIDLTNEIIEKLNQKNLTFKYNIN